jgi:hypothetical protein
MSKLQSTIPWLVAQIEFDPNQNVEGSPRGLKLTLARPGLLPTNNESRRPTLLSFSLTGSRQEMCRVLKARTFPFTT